MRKGNKIKIQGGIFFGAIIVMLLVMFPQIDLLAANASEVEVDSQEDLEEADDSREELEESQENLENSQEKPEELEPSEIINDEEVIEIYLPAKIELTSISLGMGQTYIVKISLYGIQVTFL